MQSLRRIAAVGLVTLITSTACASTSTSTSGVSRVTVYAAASLTAAFTELGTSFTSAHPGIEIRFNFAGSSALVTQIIEGAPADVFASADESNMSTLTYADGTATEPKVFTANRAAIIVPAGNPKGITSVADLARPDLIVVSCASQVPCGRYAQQIFNRAGVTVTPRSLEENVRAVVTKVTLGEADAGIVYATDVTEAGELAEGVAIPDDLNVAAQYPIAITRQARNLQGARAFVEFVMSPQAQAILESYGFVSP